jgi:hypothetical protein
LTALTRCSQGCGFRGTRQRSVSYQCCRLAHPAGRQRRRLRHGVRRCCCSCCGSCCLEPWTWRLGLPGLVNRWGRCADKTAPRASIWSKATEIGQVIFASGGIVRCGTLRDAHNYSLDSRSRPCLLTQRPRPRRSSCGRPEQRGPITFRSKLKARQTRRACLRNDMCLPGFHADQARRLCGEPCFDLAVRPVLPQHDRAA